MKLPRPRGPLTAALCEALTGAAGASALSTLPCTDLGGTTSRGDRMLGLWMLYELHYRGFDDVPDEHEWDPDLLRLRRDLETDFESELRSLTAGLVLDATAAADDVVGQLELVVGHDGPSLTRHLHRAARVEEYREFLVQRSIYHLKESDPQAWTIPRLTGGAKVALAELQYDEFGGGVRANLHQQLFADALAGAGLDPAYGAYIDQAPDHVLAVNNAMSFFGLHRRLRGASMGHLAAFEMTSSLPCRRYAQGAQRLELGPAVIRYFDEHVEADAVHEQLAARSICGGLVAEEPALQRDVLLGAAACVLLEEASAQATLEAWQRGDTSLVEPEESAAA